ncbi:MAG: FtsX-like permease family protein [Patescibacteria group bacterium]|nr:FtsX-like permease family protein [Patescibacteria group bacterium]
MRLIDVLATALKNLFRQKLRTLLTIMSMMVGAFLISIMVSVGNGLEQFMVSQVNMFSSKTTISVRQDANMRDMIGIGGGISEFQDDEENPVDDVGGETGGDSDNGDSDSSNAYEDMFSQRVMSKEDLDKLEEIDNVKEAAFQSMVIPDYVRLLDEDSKKFNVSLYAIPESLRNDLNFSYVDEDLLDADNSLVLSDFYADEWEIDGNDLIGENVMVRVTKNVVGETAASGATQAAQQQQAAQQTAQPEKIDQEFEFVIAGLTEKSLMAQMGFISSSSAGELSAYIYDQDVDEYNENEEAFEVIVIADSEEFVEELDKSIEDLGYKSITYDDAIGQIGVVFDVINAVLSSFGGIALVVASIGIVNTLLMAIYERTREIGVMKAVGATRKNIGMMFTAEAVSLGFFGGLLGLGFSWGVGRLANYVLHNGIAFRGREIMSAYLADYPGFNVSVFSLDTVLMVLAVTTVVSFVAGLYPSWRASRLDPIEALRHD